MVDWADEKSIIKIVSESINKTDVLNKLSLKNNGGNYNTLTSYINEYKIDISHFCYGGSTSKNNNHTFYENIFDVLIENSPYKSTNYLKKRLYNEGLKERICELCGQDEIWKGTKISLILDHKNGVNNDNRIENLRIVCPNCNAGLPTHCRGNRKNKKYYCECGNEKKRSSKQCVKCYNIKRNDISDRLNKRYECSKCGKKLHNNSKLCMTCYNLSQRRVERPPYEQLLEEISSLGYSGTGRKYGVSDNAIRKWKKNYEKNMNN